MPEPDYRPLERLLEGVEAELTELARGEKEPTKLGDTFRSMGFTATTSAIRQMLVMTARLTTELDEARTLAEERGREIERLKAELEAAKRGRLKVVPPD